MEKKIVSIYYYYGKNDGEELNDQFLIEDSSKERKELLSEQFLKQSDCLSNYEEFINCKDNSIEFMNEGDWDDPTSICINIESKEDLIEKVKLNYEKELKKIDKLFDK